MAPTDRHYCRAPARQRPSASPQLTSLGGPAPRGRGRIAAVTASLRREPVGARSGYHPLLLLVAREIVWRQPSSLNVVALVRLVLFAHRALGSSRSRSTLRTNSQCPCRSRHRTSGRTEFRAEIDGRVTPRGRGDRAVFASKLRGMDLTRGDSVSGAYPFISGVGCRQSARTRCRALAVVSPPDLTWHECSSSVAFMSAPCTLGFHCSHEQLPPSTLLRVATLAGEAGFAAGMCSDHFHPWSDRQGSRASPGAGSAQLFRQPLCLSGP